MALSVIKRIPLLLAALLVLSGCAYKYTTTFTVKNASERTITVRVSEAGTDSGIIVFDLEPGRQRNILTDSNKCPENYVPMDSYNADQMLPPVNDTAVLEIWVEGKKLSDDVRLRGLWHYFSTDYAEKYTLSITEIVIKDYSVPE